MDCDIQPYQNGHRETLSHIYTGYNHWQIAKYYCILHPGHDTLNAANSCVGSIIEPA